MQMTTVKLHGALQKFGESFELALSAPLDAVRALSAQLPGFVEALSTGNYHVQFDGERVGAERLGMRGAPAVIDIVPVVAGAKSGGSKIVTGVAIVTAAWASGGLAAGATGWLSTAAHAGLYIGASMALGGASQLLAPTPQASYDSKKGNTYFSGPTNSAGQGAAIPLPYGRPHVGSLEVSVSIHVEKA